MYTFSFVTAASSARSPLILRSAAAMAIVAGLALTIAPAPAAAQTAEQIEALYARDAMEQALATKRSYDLYGIHFAVGEATLLPETEKLLDDIAAALNGYPVWRLRIRGHSDSTGGAEANLVLSQARADAVKEALVERGIAATRLDAVGVGLSEPVASNETEAGRALNRRVELVRLDP